MSATAEFSKKPWDDPTERAEVYTFTPEEARWLLRERNPANRPCNPGQVKMLASELEGGYWRRNGETIIFDREGRLMNGQHRLTACVSSGVMLESWCVFGVEPDVFDTLDRTRRRSTSDDLAIRGERHYTTLAATLVLIDLEERGKLDQMWSGSNQHVAAELLARHPRVRGAVAYVCARASLRRLMPGRVASFCLYRFSEIDHHMGYEFFERLATGEMLEEGNPILLLRNRLLENHEHGTISRMQTTYILAITVKAWNAWREGRKLKFLRYRGDQSDAKPESFPVPH